MCCDGSLKNHCGSFAYDIAAAGSDSLLFKQHAPAHRDPDQLSSTRCELLGILACVEYLRYLSTKHTFDRKYFILITTDNKSAIASPTKQLKSIQYSFMSDGGDLIRSIQSIALTLPFRIRFQCIKGHQDKYKAYADLSPLAKLNVQMDSHAKLYFTDPSLAPQYSLNHPFFIHEQVLIRDSHSRIVKNFKTNLTQTSVGLQAENKSCIH